MEVKKFVHKLSKKNLNPIWNFECVFNTKPHTNWFDIVVKDYDRFTRDDYLGQIRIDLESLKNGQRLDKWYKIKDPEHKLKKENEEYGEIRLITKLDSVDLVSLGDFEIIRQVGQGRYGKVFQVKHKTDGKIFAMKTVKKSQVIDPKNFKTVENERTILIQLLRNPNPFLVRLHYAFQTVERLYFILDFVEGGELFGYLKRLTKFDEPAAKFYVAEVICVIELLHKMNIVYRDLKPENILLGKDGHIVLTDFGISKPNVHEGDVLTTFCGTPFYLAPEVVDKSVYSKEVDFWSIGVLLYEMLIGSPPFLAVNRSELYQKIKKCEYRIPSHVSQTAKSLIQGILVKNPHQRLTIEQIKKHPFFHNINWDLVAVKMLIPPMDILSTKFKQSRAAEINAILVSDDNTTLSEENQYLFRDFSFTQKRASSRNMNRSQAIQSYTSINSLTPTRITTLVEENKYQFRDFSFIESSNTQTSLNTTSFENDNII